MSAAGARATRSATTLVALTYALVLIAGLLAAHRALERASSGTAAALWIGTVVGTVLGLWAATARLRVLFVLGVMPVAMAVVVQGGVVVSLAGWFEPPSSASLEIGVMKAFLPALFCGYAALSERGGLVAFWFPTSIWMIAVLDGTGGLTWAGVASWGKLSALAALFVLFLFVREARRVAVWRSFATRALARPRPAAVLRRSPSQSIAQLAWLAGMGVGTLALAAWVAPHLWQSEKVPGAVAAATAQASAPGRSCGWVLVLPGRAGGRGAVPAAPGVPAAAAGVRRRRRPRATAVRAVRVGRGGRHGRRDGRRRRCVERAGGHRGGRRGGGGFARDGGRAGRAAATPLADDGRSRRRGDPDVRAGARGAGSAGRDVRTDRREQRGRERVLGVAILRTRLGGRVARARRLGARSSRAAAALAARRDAPSSTGPALARAHRSARLEPLAARARGPTGRGMARRAGGAAACPRAPRRRPRYRRLCRRARANTARRAARRRRHRRYARSRRRRFPGGTRERRSDRPCAVVAAMAARLRSRRRRPEGHTRLRSRRRRDDSPKGAPARGPAAGGPTARRAHPPEVPPQAGRQPEGRTRLRSHRRWADGPKGAPNDDDPYSVALTMEPGCSRPAHPSATLRTGSWSALVFVALTLSW